METGSDATQMQVLERAECERRLARGGVGRLAVAGRRSSDPPAIRPVNFAFDGSRVVIRTGDGVLREGARRSAAAEFEIDEIADADHSGWSVIVSGRLSELDAPETDSGQGRARVRPWAPGDRPYTLALSSDSITGRWIGVVPAAPAPIDVDDAAHDAWGRSEETRSRVRRVVEPFYRRWFRFRWDGLERIPTTGGVLLVANHAGAVPVDGMLLMHGIEREIGRPVYALHHYRLSEVPYVGTFLAENGGVVAHPDNALRLLRDEQRLVLVFPEGTKGTSKPYRERYRLARFGRGGFIETAMRAGVPVVPIAVVGTEETMPTLFHVRLNDELQVPVTLNTLVLGPLGALVHFPVPIRATVLEPVTFDHPPGLDHYPPGEIAAATELVRSRLQRELDRLVVGAATGRGR